MTQSELAATIGVDQSTVSLWEKGEMKPRRTALMLLTMLVDGKLKRPVRQKRTRGVQQ